MNLIGHTLHQAHLSRCLTNYLRTLPYRAESSRTVDQKIDKCLQMNIVEQAQSDWPSTILLSPKERRLYSNPY